MLFRYYILLQLIVVRVADIKRHAGICVSSIGVLG